MLNFYWSIDFVFVCEMNVNSSWSDDLVLKEMLEFILFILACWAEFETSLRRERSSFSSLRFLHLLFVSCHCAWDTVEMIKWCDLCSLNREELDFDVECAVYASRERAVCKARDLFPSFDWNQTCVFPAYTTTTTITAARRKPPERSQNKTSGHVEFLMYSICHAVFKVFLIGVF